MSSVVQGLTFLCSGTVVMKQRRERLADASGLTGPVKADLRGDRAQTMIGELGTLSDDIFSTLVLSTR